MLILTGFENKTGVILNSLNADDERKLLEKNGYFRFVLCNGKRFSDAVGCDDITALLSRYGYRAYNYKEIWEAKGLSFEKGLMVYLLSKTERYYETVSCFSDECEWVLNMVQDDRIKLALDSLIR